MYPGSSTLEEVLLSGGTADDVRLAEDLGGGYMTDLEVVHQLHCLNLLRKASHFDYYKDKAEEFTDPPHNWQLHIGKSTSIIHMIGDSILLTASLKRKKTIASRSLDDESCATPTWA